MIARRPAPYVEHTIDQIRNRLRKHVQHDLFENGLRWGVTYLDGARPPDMSKHRFAGYLSALAAKGEYRADDDIFGRILLDPLAPSGAEDIVPGARVARANTYEELRGTVMAVGRNTEMGPWAEVRWDGHKTTHSTLKCSQLRRIDNAND